MAQIPDVLLRQIAATLGRTRTHLISENEDFENALLTEVDDLLFLVNRYNDANSAQENDDSDVDSIAIG